MTRKIAISVPDDLLAVVDAESRAAHVSRSRLFGQAARSYLAIRNNPATVELGRRDGMPEACVVNCDNLVTVNQDDLVEYLTTLSGIRMKQIDDSLQFALGLD